VEEVALSDRQGEADFLEVEEPAYSGLRRRIYPREDMSVRTRRVRVNTIDHIAAGIERLKFVKLDLEGGEYHALRGGVHTIETHRPAIVFEYDRANTPDAYGYRHEDMVEFFRARDYSLFDILGVEFDSPELWDAAEVWYFLALPRERKLEAAAREAIGDLC
jgi:hypothetical protein